ncbi:MAG: hypothetical protein ACXWKW_04085 [Asticcacaulis sp.]
MDIRLELAHSLLAPRKTGKAPIMPALWASMGMAAAALFLAGMVIIGPEGQRPAVAGPIVRATEAPAVQPVEAGHASFQLSASPDGVAKDGLKGDVAPVQDAVPIGSEER